MTKTTDRAALDQWYCVDDLDDIVASPRHTRLLGQDIVMRRDSDGAILANELHPTEAIGAVVPVKERYGYAWTTLGTPARDILPIPETEEPDRNWVKCGAVNVRASGLRIVENFLDMAHFPFVHTDILGSERDTEVRHYNAEIRRDVDEVWATDCKFFQPQASMAATDGIMTDYIYRVGSPFVVMLYKTCVDRGEPLGRDLPLRAADGGGFLPGASGHVPARRQHAACDAGRSSSSLSSCRTASSSKTSGRGCCRSSRARKSRRAPTSPRSPIAAG